MTDLAKMHEGVWLPATEVHLVGMMTPGTKQFMRMPDGRAAYQRHKYLAAVEHVAHRKVFVDIGAHVGLWSMQAEQDFESIIAFEPHPVHAAIFPRNVKMERVTLHQCALGDRDGGVALTSGPQSSGDTYVSGDGDIPIRTLDSLNIERIDMLKIDTEGYELPIVRGATETLLRCRPVVVVEQKGRDALYHRQKQGGAVEFLRSLGMQDLRPPMSGDHIMWW
jgi:FkbM family methyltransferase